MKKTFLAKRNALLSPSRLTGGVAVLALALLVGGFRLLAPNLFLYVFAPIFSAGSAVTKSVETFTAGFENTEKLFTENQRLGSENADLTLKNRNLTEQLADLKALGDTRATSEGVLVGVLARPPEATYDTLILDAGTDDGIATGMEVFGPGGTPAGVIAATTNAFSRAVLFSASGHTVSGWVGEKRTALTLSGEGGGAFSARVPKTAGVAVGDGVFAPGPGALMIGTVVALENDASSPVVTLAIRPVLNPFTLTWVSVRDTGAAFQSALDAASPSL